MSARGGFGFDLIDDYILSQLIDPKQAASLTPEELNVLRANVRSEIIHSPEIREILVRKVEDVRNDLGG